ncbi:GTA head formation protein, RCAP_rcc01685 family [Pseudooceanicola sp. C21-150M6]|uniref:GTA head formation protein, RCAP_rcc01685 family n=1 Tax=Pseudooceanicola sp. C21-150M6 TaxID=3434355 RepID=UPI003D7F8502
MTDHAPRRYGFESFDCAPALRLEAHERVSRLENDRIHDQLTRLEVVIERLERRLWLTVYGVVAVILAEGFQSILTRLP